MSRRDLLISLIAGLVLAVATTAPTALAQERFDLRAAGEETEGRARSVGTAVLQQNGRRDRVVVKARLNDICPADGYGAYLEVRAYYPGGYSSGRRGDTRGCRADPMRVTVRTGWLGPSKPIYRVTVRLVEHDIEAGDIAFLDQDSVEYTPEELEGGLYAGGW